MLVRHGLVMFQKRRRLTGETDQGMSGVEQRTTDVEIYEVDVPVVLVAAFVSLRTVDDAGVVGETDEEIGREIAQVGDKNHHLAEVVSIVFFHKRLQFLPRGAPHMVPGGVGDRVEDGIAWHGGDGG